MAAVIRFLIRREAGHLNGVILPLDAAENLMKGLDHLCADRLTTDDVRSNLENPVNRGQA